LQNFSKVNHRFDTCLTRLRGCLNNLISSYVLALCPE